MESTIQATSTRLDGRPEVRGDDGLIHGDIIECTPEERARIGTLEPLGDGPHEYVTGTTEPLTLEHDEIGSIEAPAPTHILAGIDEDIEADLAAIGVNLTPGAEVEMENARRQAYAALLFRRVQKLRREIRETEQARDLELGMVRAHYERQITRPRAAVATLLDFIATLARLTVWGKKRSHATPYGTFGVRKASATVQVTDEAAALAWARTEQPEMVRVTIALPLDEARQFFTDDEIDKHKVSLEWGKLKKTLSPEAETLPPGVVKVDGGDEPFATVEEG
jgi:hypothetical protein